MKKSDLHVIAVISNPRRYRSRVELWEKFKANMIEIHDANLHVLELQFGERPADILLGNGQDYHMQTYEEIWHKENMINCAIAKLPTDWKYIAWIDADIEFTRRDWASETIHMLQHHYFVQMWENAIDLGPKGQTINTHRSFMAHYWDNLRHFPAKNYLSWHPGFAWAARREAIDFVGGLIDIGILGSGDRHMAGAMIGQVDKTYNSNVHPNYIKHLNIWQQRCERHIRRDVGFVPGTILHSWHGKKKDRQYADRWKILVEHQFDPEADLKKDWQGIYQLHDHGDVRSIRLRDDIRKYFCSRNEDSIDLF